MTISDTSNTLAQQHSATTLRNALVRRLEMDVAAQLDAIKSLQTPRPERAKIRIEQRVRQTSERDSIERIAEVIKIYGAPMMVKEVCEALPDISPARVQQILGKHFDRISRGVYCLKQVKEQQ